MRIFKDNAIDILTSCDNPYNFLPNCIIQPLPVKDSMSKEDLVNKVCEDFKVEKAHGNEVFVGSFHIYDCDDGLAVSWNCLVLGIMRCTEQSFYWFKGLVKQEYRLISLTAAWKALHIKPEVNLKTHELIDQLFSKVMSPDLNDKCNWEVAAEQLNIISDILKSKSAFLESKSNR